MEEEKLVQTLEITGFELKLKRWKKWISQDEKSKMQECQDWRTVDKIIKNPHNKVVFYTNAMWIKWITICRE